MSVKNKIPFMNNKCDLCCALFGDFGRFLKKKIIFAVHKQKHNFFAVRLDIEGLLLVISFNGMNFAVIDK